MPCFALFAADFEASNSNRIWYKNYTATEPLRATMTTFSCGDVNSPLGDQPRLRREGCSANRSPPGLKGPGPTRPGLRGCRKGPGVVCNRAIRCLLAGRGVTDFRPQRGEERRRFGRAVQGVVGASNDVGGGDRRAIGASISLLVRTGARRRTSRCRRTRPGLASRPASRRSSARRSTPPRSGPPVRPRPPRRRRARPCLRSNLSTPRLFITRRTRSTASPPICSPQLPLASCMKTGPDHPSAVRHDMTPEPYSPPTMNAAFFIEGITTTHCALVHRFSGMPLSGAARSSVRIAPACDSRFVSSLETAADGGSRRQTDGHANSPRLS